MPYTVLRRTDARGLQIELPPRPSDESLYAYRAKTLAWAYLKTRLENDTNREIAFISLAELI
jgi:hypothetical protein